MAKIRVSVAAGQERASIRANAGMQTTGGTMLGPEPSPSKATGVPLSGCVALLKLNGG